MHAVHAQLGGRAAVYCASQLGMGTAAAAAAAAACQTFSLEEQIEHKVELLNECFSAPGRPLVLIGHSIGVYIAIHALHRLEQRRRGQETAAAAAAVAAVKLVGLYPFLTGRWGVRVLSTRPNPVTVHPLPPAPPLLHPRFCRSAVDPECPRQMRLRSLTAHHALLARMAGWVGLLLPLAVRRLVVRWLAPHLAPHAVDTVATSGFGCGRGCERGCEREDGDEDRCGLACSDVAAAAAASVDHPTASPPPPAAAVFCSRACVANGLYLGRTEFEVLAAPADWALLRALGPRLAMFGAPRDAWCKVRARGRGGGGGGAARSLRPWHRCHTVCFVPPPLPHPPTHAHATCASGVA